MECTQHHLDISQRQKDKESNNQLKILMFYQYFTIRKSTISIFLLLVVIVSWLQVTLLAPHLQYGFTPDDWWPLALYKRLNSDLLTNILQVWEKNGVYTSYQVMYISILHNFFGFNFQAYQITNLILKALSALILFPFILTIFKSRLLAILTTILYAMAYSPVGTLEIVVRGSDFIGIIFMCIFFIAYYQVIVRNLNNVLPLTGLMALLLLSMFFSPIRIYPVLVFILLVELYLCLIQRTKLTIYRSVKRIAFIFFPYILMMVLSPSSVFSFTSVNAPEILRRISMGNWQLILYPLGSFGSLFLLNDYWRIFGIIQIKSFTDYISYLLVDPLIIFLFITLFYSIILSIPSKNLFRFFLKILSVNLLLQIAVFILAKHREVIDSNIRMSYDYVELYSVLFAVYMLALSFFVWRHWINTGKKNNLLLSLWLGPFFALVHIVLTWMFKDYVVLFKGIHTYLNIPSIGISLFIAGTLGLLYQKIRNSFGILGKQLAFQTFLLLIPIFIINKNTIQYNFDLASYSMNAKEHEAARDRLWNKLSNFDNNHPSLFYFDAAHDYPNGRFYEQSMLGRFSEWMFFKGDFPPGSCNVPVFINSNLDLLRSKFIEKDGEVGFSYADYCGRPNFYKYQDFYAFRLVNKQPTDIKDEILEQFRTNLR